MPIFSIQAPDGKTYRVQGPDQAGAIEYLQSQIEGNKSTQPSQPNYNPPGTGLGRALKRGLYRTGQAGNLLSANINSNMLANMDVNKVETLDRALKLSMPPETYDRVRKYAWDYLGMVETDEDLNSWLDDLGELGVMSQHIAKVKAMTSAAEAAKTDYREEGGKFDQIEQRGNRALEKAGEKQKEIDALPMSPTAQTGAQDFQNAEGVLDWAKSSFKNPLGALAFIGEIAAESTPSIAAGLATTLLTGNPVAGAGVMVLSGAPQSYSGEFVEFLREKNIDLTDPEAIKNALQNDDILAEANRRGMTKAAIIAFFEALGMKAGGGILRQTAAQSTTGGAGEGASSYVLDGEIVLKDMALEAVAETATVPGEVAIMKGRSLFNRKGKIQPDYNDLSTTEKQAGADVARLLREISATNGYNLRDTNVASDKGGKKALEAARKRIIDRLRELKSDAAIKPLLSPKQRKSLDQLLDDFAPANGAFRAANNKVSDRVTQDQYDSVMRLLPDSKEKQEIANLLRMSNQVTDLFNQGLKGGISQYTDYFNPFIKDGSYDPNRAANVIIGTGAGLTLGPVPTAGIVAGGRTFDFVTGRRAAAVDRFVRSNEKKPGLDAPSGNSLIQAQADAEAAAQQQTEQEAADAETARFNRRQMNLELTQRNAAPTPDSPQAIMEDATGLDRSGVARVLRIIEATADNPAILDAIASYRKSIAQGGKVKDLSPLIRMVNERIANNPGLVDRVREPNNSLQPNVDTTGPAQPQGGDEFGPQFTTPENYNRGIEDNKAFRQDLQNQVLMNPDIKGDEQIKLLASLAHLRDNLGSSPVPNALQEIQDLEDSGVVSQENIDTYVRPYVDRIIKQQRRNAPEQPTVQTDEEIQAEAEQFGQDIAALFKEGRSDESINPNIPLPTFDKEAALAPTTPVVHQQVDAPKGETNHGFLPHLRTDTSSFRDGKPLFTIKTNNKNALPQIQAIDEVLQRHPDPASSQDAWSAMMGDALASKDIPVQPNGFIEDINNGGAQELLSKLTPGQIADADHGFRNAAKFRKAYTDGEIGIEDTGRLFLWSFLSRGVSPYTQEGLFMDSFDGIEPWIRMAAGKSNRGSLEDNIGAYKKWASSTAPKGSGKPGAGAMHNLNAFGETFLLKMGQDAGKGDGRSRLQVLHDMMSDPKSTGKEVRREFLKMGEGVGIDNKVVSFTLLVAGYPDVMVLDRVQMRQMWNDGRFSGLNLYDGYKNDGNVVTGSGLSQLTYGARGLLVYEAMEKSLENKLNQIYTDVGRPQAASVGRYHWDTWVASSEQEASHGTIDAILARAKGDPNPLDGVTAKEGEYGAYAYGARYGLENGVPMFTYDVPDRGTFKFTVPDFKTFLNDIKRKAKSNKVIPQGFSVKESGNAPWYTREGVNLDALAEKAKEYGKQIQGTNDGIRQGSSVSNGRTVDAISGATDEQRVPALANRSQFSGRGPSAARNDDSPLRKTSLERVKQFILAKRPAFQVGKKGGELEDGVQDIDSAVGMANGLGMTVKLFNSIEDMNNAKREAGLPVSANSSGTFYRSIKETDQGLMLDTNAKGFEGTVFALKPGAIMNNQPISDIEALMTILHEMSHGITLGNMQISERQNEKEDFFNPYNNDFDHAPEGSFARSALLPSILASSPEVSKGVLQEIQDLQEKVDVYTTNNPKERTAVRSIRKLFARMDNYEALGASQESMQAIEGQVLSYLQYTRNIRETAADPVAVYLLNPKLAKKLMPKTTALIRSEFSKAQNPKLQFFSHPFAVVAAVVMAMMAAKDEEDEQRRMMPPPGALNQPMQPGALSA